MNSFYELRRKVEAVAGNIFPPNGYWLISDAGPSYCKACVRQERWEEMGNVGTPPFLERSRFYPERDPIEENIASGIDGGFDAGNHDNTQSCERCGIGLAYWLTHDGILDEIAFYEESPGAWSTDLRAEAYAIDRLFEVVEDELINSVSAIAERFLQHVEDEQL